MASAAGGGSVHLWEVTTGRQVLSGTARGRIEGLTFSPDGRRLAGSTRAAVTLWDTASGREVLVLPGVPRTRDPIFNPRVAFSPDGTRLAANQWEPSILIWEAPS